MQTFFVVFTIEKLGPDEWIYACKREFVEALSPQEAVDEVAEKWRARGYCVGSLQVYQRIKNEGRYFWTPREKDDGKV